MPSLPAVSGKDVVAAFQAAGFHVARQEGSHVILKRAGHRFHLSVPCHSGQDIKQGTLRRLIRDAGLSVEQFVELL
jgi:predicted RNA binding protein YcfA (HicA-like mRNA interferase family)